MLDYFGGPGVLGSGPKVEVFMSDGTFAEARTGDRDEVFTSDRWAGEATPLRFFAAGGGQLQGEPPSGENSASFSGDPSGVNDPQATGGGSDGNFTAALGIPTLDGLGGVGEGARDRARPRVAAALDQRPVRPAGAGSRASTADRATGRRIGGGGGGFGGFQPPANLSETLTANERRLEEIRKMLRDAEAYGRAQDAYAKDKSLPRPDRNVVLEPLVPYVRGEQPVIFRADREAEIRGAIKFAEEMKLKPIILGGNDAWKVATLLKEKNVPVILTGIFSLPSREDDAYDTLYEQPAKLQQAGVRYAISTGDAGAEVRNLAQYAGMAAAYGLSKSDAVKAVTLYPAQIMNVADRLGSIEAGKMANLVVTDGDLLEIRTRIRYLFIDGRPVVLTSRHTELNDAFKDRK